MSAHQPIDLHVDEALAVALDRVHDGRASRDEIAATNRRVVEALLALPAGYDAIHGNRIDYKNMLERVERRCRARRRARREERREARREERRDARREARRRARARRVARRSKRTTKRKAPATETETTASSSSSDDVDEVERHLVKKVRVADGSASATRPRTLGERLRELNGSATEEVRRRVVMSNLPVHVLIETFFCDQRNAEARTKDWVDAYRNLAHTGLFLSSREQSPAPSQVDVDESSESYSDSDETSESESESDETSESDSDSDSDEYNTEDELEEEEMLERELAKLAKRKRPSTVQVNIVRPPSPIDLALEMLKRHVDFDTTSEVERKRGGQCTWALIVSKGFAEHVLEYAERAGEKAAIEYALENAPSNEEICAARGTTWADYDEHQGAAHSGVHKIRGRFLDV